MISQVIFATDNTIHKTITTKLEKNTTHFFPIFSEIAPPIRQPKTHPRGIEAPNNRKII